MPRFRTTLALLTLTAAAALAIAAPAGALYRPFRTPSGLVGCAYTTNPTYLRCDTRYTTRFQGSRNCGDTGDSGNGFGMTRRGRARVLCISDTVLDPSAKPIPYGTTRKFGSFRCTSRTSGLTCRNRKGHGWTLSKQSQTLF